MPISTYDPVKHHRPFDFALRQAQGRRSIRWPRWDYRDGGAYFVTVVTHERECLFGEVVDGEMVLSDFGRIAVEEWERTATLRPHVRLDAFAVMPNHFHGIIWIVDGDCVVGAQRRCAPTNASSATNGN